jgi:hypothetical protein
MLRSALLVLLLAVIAAASVLTNVPAPPSCPTPCGCSQASLDPQFVWNNVIALNQVGSTVGSNPSPVIAVGPDRILTSAAGAFSLYNKTTNEVISTWSYTQFYQSGNALQGYVSYDTIHARFWVTWLRVKFCMLILTVDGAGPDAGIKCATRAVFGPQTYVVSGTVVLATFASGCNTITNCAQLAGNVALIPRAVCSTFAVGINQTQVCGATAAIVYDNVIEPLLVMGAPAGFNITIPSIFINLTDGNALLAASPVNVTLSSPFVTTFYSTVVVAVSQGTSPNSRLDFFVQPYTNTLWNSSLLSGPRHAWTSDTFYISTQVFAAQLPDQSFVYTGPSLVALPKLTLMGNGPVTTATWQKNLPSTQSPVVVAEVRTPLLSQNTAGWFVGLGPTAVTADCATEVTHLSVYWGTSATQPSSTPYLLQLPTPICALALNLAGNIAGAPTPMGARQPPPAVPAGLQVDPSFASATMDGKIIAFAFAFNVSSVHTIVCWGAVDLGTFWSNGQLSLKHFAFVNPVPGALDGIYPKIDIDVQGNIALVLFTSSTSKFGGGSYTGRLASDPPNTLRYPLINWATSNNTYYAVNQLRNPGAVAVYDDNINHWLNFNGLARDPNGMTFYAYTAVPNPVGPFDSNGRTQSWTTTMTAFNITQAPSCPPRYPTVPLNTPVDLAFEARYAIAHPNGFTAVVGGAADATAATASADDAAAMA